MNPLEYWYQKPTNFRNLQINKLKLIMKNTHTSNDDQLSKKIEGTSSHRRGHSTGSVHNLVSKFDPTSQSRIDGDDESTRPAATAHEQTHPDQPWNAATTPTGWKKGISRGKDWDSVKFLDRDRVESTAFQRRSYTQSKDEPTKKDERRKSAGIVMDEMKHPKRRPSSLKLSAFVPENLNAIPDRAIHLELSSIFSVYTSPTTAEPQRPNEKKPPPKVQVPSPGPSLGPPSSTSPSLPLPPSPQPHPSGLPTELPKYVSAFEWAMRPWLELHLDQSDNLALPAPFSPISTAPPTPSLAGDEISYASSPTHSQAFDIPDTLLSTQRHILALRCLLLRCTTLHTTIKYLQHKPWAVDADRPIYWHFSKIRVLGLKAMQFAEALKSCRARARCAFWIGVGFAGTRDWESAERWFEEAARWDTGELGGGDREDDFDSVTARSGGLRWRERRDLGILLEDVRLRATKERARAEEVMVARTSMLDDDLYGGDAYFGRVDANSNAAVGQKVWMPLRDRITGVVVNTDMTFNEDLGIAKQRNPEEPVLEGGENGEDLEPSQPSPWDRKMHWRKLSRSERAYIKRDHLATYGREHFDIQT